MPKIKNKQTSYEKDLSDFVKKFYKLILYFSFHFRLIWDILCNHQKTISKSKLLTHNSNVSFNKALSFWLMNIFLVYIFASFFGFKPGDYLFKIPFSLSIPFIQFDPLRNIVSPLMRHVGGIFAFWFILKIVINREQFKNKQKIILKLFFFSSAIFIPYFFITYRIIDPLREAYFNNFLEDHLLKTISSFFRTGNIILESFFKILSQAFLVFATEAAFSLLFIIWWLRFIYFGFVSLEVADNRKQIKRILIKFCLWFLIIQFCLSLLPITIISWKQSRPIRIIAFKEVEKVLSKKQYKRAEELCEIISNNKFTPPYFKYVGKIRSLIYKIPYLLISPSEYKFFDSIFTETANWDWKSDYRKIHLKIDVFLKDFINKSKDNKKILEKFFYEDFVEELREAENLFKKCDYENDRKAQFISFMFHASNNKYWLTTDFWPINPEVNEGKSLDFKFPIYMGEPIISIFPRFTEVNPFREI